MPLHWETFSLRPSLTRHLLENYEKHCLLPDQASPTPLPMMWAWVPSNPLALKVNLHKAIWLPTFLSSRFRLSPHI